jgi:hypothetical protein
MESKTKIILTRSSEWMNRLRVYRVFIDGMEIGSVKNGSSEEFAVMPGAHKIQCKQTFYSSPEFDINLRQDEILYLRTRTAARLYWPLYFLLIAGIFIGFIIKNMSQGNRPDWLLWVQIATILPFVVYMLYYFTLGRKKFLMIEEDKENVFAN